MIADLTHNRTPAAARIFKAAATNEIKSNHRTKITRGNYNRRKTTLW
jgi:hypothetical protein